MPICRPATASRCARPEAVKAARSGGGIPVVTPVSSVTQIAPAAPGTTAGNALCDHLAETLHDAKRTERGRLGDALDTAQRVAGTGLATEPGVALEVPAAGIGRRHRRPHQCSHANGVARGDFLSVALPQPHSQPALTAALRHRDSRFQRDPASLGEQLDRTDLARQNGRWVWAASAAEVHAGWRIVPR